MPNLESLIDQWRRSCQANSTLTAAALDELENHLRENVERLMATGLSLPEAFHQAANQLGPPDKLASEFAKVHHPLWLPVKLLAGLWALVAVMVAASIMTSARLGSDLLLAGHVFTVTLGYLAVFLTGALGICFILQRCVSDLPSSLVASIQRATFRFTQLALLFTTIAVLLGALWAKAEWGRYWAWDAKETGGFCLVVWLTAFLLMHRLSSANQTRILALTLVGNVVVGLAWFGPALVDSLQSSPASSYLAPSIAAAAVVFHIGLFILSLARPAWLRRSQA